MRLNLDNIQIDINDFQQSNWKLAIEALGQKDYSSMWQAFSSFARQAIEEDRQTHSKVLWLLADACSMMLQPSSTNTPFRPFAMIEGRDVQRFLKTLPNRMLSFSHRSLIKLMTSG